jgi:phosphogluconate dehydratase
MIALDCDQHTLQLEVSEAELAARSAPTPDLSANQHGTGRDIFALFRAHAALAEQGASPLFSSL